MPRIDQKLVNSPINMPSMAIDGAIDAIYAINGNSFRRTPLQLEVVVTVHLRELETFQVFRSESESSDSAST